MNILKKITSLRLEKNWTLYKLSVESGISQSALSNMYTRQTLPSITTLTSICDAFGITLSDFFKEDDGENSQQENELLFNYKKLDEKDKNAVLNLIKNLI